ncbi:MAG: methyltransferase domain-containing protein [Candidatus Shapirobacteria bacterium]
MNSDKLLSLIEADITTFKFKQPNNFDLIYCSQLVEHLQEPEILFKKVYSALKANGTFLISTVYRKSWAKYIYKNKYGQSVLAHDHINEYQEISILLNQLRESGFNVTDYDITMFRFPIIDLIIKPCMQIIRNKKFINFCNSRLIMELRYYFVIPIIGFYNIQLIANPIK